MSVDARSWAALIAGCAAILAAIVSEWLRRRSTAELTKAQTKLAVDLEGVKALHKQQLDRAQISEQMRADLRLRLFQDDERRVAEVMQHFRDCFATANEVVWHYAKALTSGSKVNAEDIRPIGRLTADLVCRGLLLPDELVEYVDRAEYAIRDTVASIREQKEAGAVNAGQQKIRSTLHELERAASRWRTTRISELLL